jgi:hypothetical protein
MPIGWIRLYSRTGWAYKWWRVIWHQRSVLGISGWRGQIYQPPHLPLYTHTHTQQTPHSTPGSLSVEFDRFMASSVINPSSPFSDCVYFLYSFSSSVCLCVPLYSNHPCHYLYEHTCAPSWPRKHVCCRYRHTQEYLYSTAVALIRE